MLKSKKIKIIAFVAASFMAISGIVMIAYAIAVTRNITGCITYDPGDGKLDAYYYISYVSLGSNSVKDYTYEKITFAGNDSTDTISPTFTNTDGFIVFKLDLSTAYDVEVNCLIWVTIPSDMYIVGHNKDGGITSDFGTLVGGKYEAKIVFNKAPVAKSETIYIRVGLNGNASASITPKNINIEVSIELAA